jgi:MerR family mercuric resistance operon transcriptional regulator
MEAPSKHSGVDGDTIRACQRLGLFPKPRSVIGGLALYRLDDVDRIRFVTRALDLGFSAAAIRDLVKLADRKTERCAEVKAMAERHLDDLNRRIADLQRMAASLRPLVSGCSAGMAISKCPIIQALSAVPHGEASDGLGSF